MQDPEYKQVGISADRQEIIQLAARDPDVIAAFALGEDWKYPFPPVFLNIFAWFAAKLELTRDFSRLAIGLPRGFGKTTFAKIMILYILLFTDRRFILILSSNVGHAINIIMDIMSALETPEMITVFGDYRVALEIDRQDLKVFTFRGRRIIIAGIGSGGSVRGFNLGNRRPDFMLFDDVQLREEADSPKVSRDLYTWMNGTAMKAKDPERCLYLFLGNMYPTEHSILKWIIADPFWEKYIAGGILHDPITGELSSLWEDLQPLDQLLNEYAADKSSGNEAIFQAEVMNDPNAQVNNTIDMSTVHYWTGDDHDLHDGSFVVIDPATDKLNADNTSVGYFQVHNVVPYLWEVHEGVMNPGDTIMQAIKYCISYGCRVIFVEGGAYQSTLKYWFEVIFDMIGLEGITVLEILPGGTAKTRRITRMFTQLTGKELGLHPRVVPLVSPQVTGFDPLRTDNNDGILDLLTYAPKILAEYKEFIRDQGVFEMQVSSINMQEAARLALTNNAAPF